jgi:hypothetical protein
MNRRIQAFTLAAALSALCLYSPAALAQQCPNIAGNPAPTLNVDLVQKVALNDGPGVGWGGGNERYKYKKGLFATSVPFDPLATHNLTVTFHVNTVNGLLIGSTTVFAADPFWTSPSPGRWVYNNPGGPWPFGIRRIDIRELSPNQYLVTKILGRDANLGNMPLTATDDMHVMLEIWDASNIGDCADSTLTSCNGAGTVCSPF